MAAPYSRAPFRQAPASNTQVYDGRRFPADSAKLGSRALCCRARRRFAGRERWQPAGVHREPAGCHLGHVLVMEKSVTENVSFRPSVDTISTPKQIWPRVAVAPSQPCEIMYCMIS